MSPSESYAEFGRFRLYPLQRRLLCDGAPVPIGGRAMDLLISLVENAGAVVERRALMARAWPNVHVEESSLRVHVSGLRKALGEGRDGVRYIVNVAGRGYCFVAPVTLRTETPAAPVEAGAALPRRSTRIIDRQEEVKALASLLDEHRFVTIHGPGGIGKTTVALVVASAAADRFPDGVRFVDLGLLPTGGSVAEALASALGLVVQSNDLGPSIANYLRRRRMLLVLDCCEHVVESAAEAAELVLGEADGVSLLATSREPLRAAGEHVYPLHPLELPPERGVANVEQLLAYPAARLFHERAVASGHRADWADADAPLVAEICRKVDGIALALELAGGRVGTHGLRDTASLLNGRLTLLWRGQRTAPPRHQTLSATLDWSFDLISETERTVLRRLSTLVGAFTLEEALAIAGDERLQPAEVAEALSELAAKSLVMVDTQAPDARYRLLDTTRTYALAKLAASDDCASTTRRHAVYFRDRAAGAAGRAPAQRRTSSSDSARVLPNVRAALQWAFSETGDPLFGIELAASAAPLFLELSLLRDARLWAERALSAMPDEMRGSRPEMVLQGAMGHALILTSHHAEALTALERALQIAETLGDGPQQFRLLSSLHIFQRRTAAFGSLLGTAGRARALAESLGDARMIAATNLMVATSHHLSGDQAATLAALDAGSGDPSDPLRFTTNFLGSSAEALFVLARALWLNGSPDQALAALRAAERASQTDPLSTCQALILALGLFGMMGEWTIVDAYLDRLIPLAADHALEPYGTVGAAFRGEALIRRGEVDAGLTLLRPALAWLRSEGFRLHIPWFTAVVAEGLATRGHFDQALGLLEPEIAQVERNGSAYYHPELLRIHGRLLACAGDSATAEHRLRAAIELADRQSALSWRLRAAVTYAELGIGQPGQGRATLTETYDRFREGFDTPDLRRARALLQRLTER